MSIIFIGDLHLSDDQPWAYQGSKDMVDYIISHPLNNPDNTFLFLGDITDKASIYGSIQSLLNTLITGLKVKESYWVIGNHDSKIRHDSIVTPYDHYEDNHNNFHIIKKYSTITIEGTKILCLPHINPTQNEYLKQYETLSDVSECDIVCGHIADTSCTIPNMETINLSHIKEVTKYKHKVLGHIHVQDRKNGYIGSMIATNIAESGTQRSLWEYTNGKMVYHDIPQFVTYQDVEYPKPLPRPEGKTVVWTIYNCTDEALAKEYYHVDNIRKVVYTIEVDGSFKNFSRQETKENQNLSLKETMKLFMKEEKIEENSDLEKLLLKYLTYFNGEEK